MSTESEAAHRLLLSPRTPVTCPKCGAKFSLQEGFARLALEKFEQSTEGALVAVREAERAAADARAQQLAAQRDKTLRTENTQLQQLLKEQGAKHAEALSRIANEAQARAQSLFAADRQALEQELAQKSQQVAELRSAELALRKEKSELHDRAAAFEIEVARKLDAGRAELEVRVRTQERERAELEKAELKKRLDDVNAQLVEAQRKGNQSSQQLQGEVLELTLQQDLEEAFPLDVIEEVRKGARGGDVIQRVMTRGGQTAGILLWEAKRAKDWSAQWVGKLKEDVGRCGADVGVLVSIGTAFPREWEPGQLFGLYEEVWVTSWTTALQLATVLRLSLLDVHKQRLISAGKGEKMEAVYDYLTSSQFAHKLKAMYSAFHHMRQELEAEKSQTLQRWARREKQLQSGVAELVGVAGDIQGLAQQELPLLEMENSLDSELTAEQRTNTLQLGLKIDK
ncbi:MAG TPA: DUF2130 domain-containing protein [Steroidobacteraceae bacterium]|nr:DUF2130 domain-containing protein [Steroidobacteraceae bacterium]